MRTLCGTILAAAVQFAAPGAGANTMGSDPMATPAIPRMTLLDAGFRPRLRIKPQMRQIRRLLETFLQTSSELYHINLNLGHCRLLTKSVSIPIDGKPLENWRIALKPLSVESVAKAKASDGRDGFSGGHFRAVVKLDKTADTFIDMSKWKKGTVYVNGRNIGRYWNVGPQLSLYCAAPFLVCGENTIDIMELELTEPQPIRGLARPCYLDSGISTKNAANEW